MYYLIEVVKATCLVSQAWEMLEEAFWVIVLVSLVTLYLKRLLKI